MHTLYVSPLKELTVDVHRNLLQPIAEMHLSIRAETSTGDTPAARRRRQRAEPPHILLTTPETLARLLSYVDAADYFAARDPRRGRPRAGGTWPGSPTCCDGREAGSCTAPLPACRR